MNKKTITIGIVTIFFLTTITPLTQGIVNKESNHPKSNGNTLFVGGTGEGNYTKIQHAINDANDGDTVFVFNGTYYESIIVNKSINLIGECMNSTVIYGWDEEGTVNIVSNWVNFSEFSIRWESYISIKIISDFNTISNINISNSWGYGIYISNTSNGNCIIRNIISEAGYDYYSSIFLDSTHSNIIMDNTISNNFLGIDIDYSNHNIVENNNFSGNANCISLYFSDFNIVNNNSYIDNAHGIMVRNSSNNILRGNYLYPYVGCTTFYLCSSHNNIVINNTIFHGSNLWIYMSDNNTIKDNTISESHGGIDLVNASNNTIFCNNLISNYFYGLSCIPDYEKDYKPILSDIKCDHFYDDNIRFIKNKRSDSQYGNNNTIYHNNFINNSQNNAYDECNNIWDKDYLSGGNYWDDYTGEDNDGDGIGDTAYLIPGGDNEDRYPLMIPWGGNHPPSIPVIEGKRKFKEGEGGEYQYTIYSVDPDEDYVSYLINWSDGTQEWTDFYESGKTFTINITIPLDEGTYFIFKVKAKDFYDLESDWATLEIEVPRTRVLSYLWYQWFLERFLMLERLLSFILFQ